jgi:hypothetical protein
MEDFIDFNKLSWAEIQTVSKDLSAYGEKSEFFAKVMNSMSLGVSKYDAEIGAAKLIGVNHDIDQNNLAVGMTFTVTSPLLYNISKQPGNLIKYGVRRYFYKFQETLLPEQLRQVIRPARKVYYYNNQICSTVEKLFVPSVKEVYGTPETRARSLETIMGQSFLREGYQYELFQKQDQSPEDETKENETLARLFGQNGKTLLRTQDVVNNKYYAIDYDGSLTSVKPGNNCKLAYCFCV